MQIKEKLLLWTELVLVYIILPLLFTYIYFDIVRMPLLLVLLVAGIVVLIILIRDKKFDNKSFLNLKVFRKELFSILKLFIPFIILSTLATYFFKPDWLFFLPKSNPWLLLLISIFYPIFSVIPQGIIYRSLYFHRYSKLLNNKYLTIILAGILFGFGHILFKNWFVLILTSAGGILFAYRYMKTKSLSITIIEQSLYGVWLFTCGLGRFLVSSMVE